MQTTTPAAVSTTSTTTSTTTRSEFLDRLDAAIADVHGQCLLSQGRCVDHLLDLFNLTSDPVVRAAVTFAIDDIRRLSAVRAEELVDGLRMIAAVAEIEGVFSAEG
jgi:hypothetical protein